MTSVPTNGHRRKGGVPCQWSKGKFLLNNPNNNDTTIASKAASPKMTTTSDPPATIVHNNSEVSSCWKIFDEAVTSLTSRRLLLDWYK